MKRPPFTVSGWLLLAGLAACGAGGSDDESPQPCVFRGPYSLAYTLTSGNTAPWQPPPGPTGEQDLPLPGCSRGASYVPNLQTTDVDACTVVACYGDGCIALACDWADPVASCSGTSTSTYARGERTCAYAWTMTRAE